MDQVLIVDDCRLVRTLAHDALSEVGFSCFEAETPMQAREAMESGNFNLILLDVVLEEANGIDLMEELLESHPGTLFVIMSGYSSVEMASQAIKRGAYDYLAKPFRKEELIITVRKALDHFWLSHQRDLLIDKLNRRIQRLESFEELSKAISSTNDPAALVDLGLRLAQELLAPSSASFVMCARGSSAQRCYRLRQGGGSEWRIEPREGSCMNEVSTSVMVSKETTRRSITRSGSRVSALSLPLVMNEELLGILQLEKEGGASFSQDDESVARFLASHLAIGVHNALITEELRLSKKEIESYNRRLEEMVRKRTLALEEKTQLLERTQDQLVQREKMASIGQLVAGVAHEINNPIAFVGANIRAIRENAAMLKRLLDEDGQTAISSLGAESPVDSELLEVIVEIDEIVEDSLDGIERIARIVRSLKDFSARGSESPELTQINDQIEKALKLVHNELKYKVTVHRDYGDLPEIDCYGSQLVQVFVNILVNAAQAIEESGNIWIQTRDGETDIRIAIADDGPGVPDEIAQRVFDPFFTTKEVGKGTGLGLSVSYGIIDKHHGTIRVAPSRAGGACFEIEIPKVGVDEIVEHTMGKDSCLPISDDPTPMQANS